MKMNDEMQMILEYNLNLFQKKESTSNGDKKVSVEKLIEIYKNILKKDPTPTKEMIAKNVAALEQLANNSKEPSYWEAMSLLGFCYHEGLGIAKDRSKAFVHWEKAAKEGAVMSAQFWLSQSKVLRHDKEVPRFDKKAEQELLNKAVANKYAPAMVEYASNMEQEITFHQKKIRRQKSTEQNGNLDKEKKKAQERSIKDEDSLKKEWLELYKEPLKLYRQAADLNYSDGLFHLGFFYINRKLFTPQQNEIGWAYIETAAAKYNHAKSLYFLAYYYNYIANNFDNIYLELEDHQKENILKLTPKDLLHIACLHGISSGTCLQNADQEYQELSEIQLRNRSLKKEEISKKSFELCLRSAKFYNVAAMHMLYLDFESKMGNENRKWLELAADLGHVLSRTSLAAFLLDTGDVKAGMEMLIPLSQNRKNALAQFMLAKVYIGEINSSGIKVQNMMISLKERQIITMLSYCQIVEPTMGRAELSVFYTIGTWPAFKKDYSERASIIQIHALLVLKSGGHPAYKSEYGFKVFLSIMPEVRRHFPNGVPIEFDEILAKYELEALAGNARAKCIVGFIYQLKLGSEMYYMENEDRIVTAIDWYFEALEGKEYSCLSDLWICCQSLIDDDFDMVQRNVQSLMKLCCEYTDLKQTEEIPTHIKKEAYLILAEIFEQGIFVDYNLTKAVECYEKAKELDIHDTALESKIAKIIASLPIFTSFRSYKSSLDLTVSDATCLPTALSDLVIQYAADHRDFSSEIVASKSGWSI